MTSKTIQNEQLPKAWQTTELGLLCSDMIGGGTPSTAHKDYWGGEIPWMTSAHINGRKIVAGQKYITKKGLEKSASNLVPKDNVLVATRVGIGKVAINKIDVAISQDLTGLILDKSKALPEFVYWQLAKDQQKIKSLAQGSTIKGVLRTDLAKLKILLPSLTEQQSISDILSSVDDAISLVERERDEQSNGSRWAS
ncbi:MAG: restriction endonuclease subunit S [Candidatus Diapherotrites archaeon]|uniref:Restriction endonuclease subunit S n=1 Tax=Candidatus Iainarchaeum sp. TaxID=3101447 RepID=A0A8T3YKB1_9ARCH|nr:restriction endonuclease subunit S [Candidatus Diapherotrites archaeon]